MEELEQFRERYLGLTSAEVRDLIRDDSVFRREIETLYVAIFHASLNKTCSDCWLDAYIILCRTQTEKLMELKSRKFELRPGALLIDVVGHDNAKMASSHNLTDELALYHLSTNPGCIRKFSKFPENWQQLAALQQATKAAQTEDHEPHKPVDGNGNTNPTTDKSEEEIAAEQLAALQQATKAAQTEDHEPHKPVDGNGNTNPTTDKSEEEIAAEQLAALQQATKAAQTAVRSAETRLAKVRKGGDEKQIAQAEKRLAKAIDLLNGIEEGVK